MAKPKIAPSWVASCGGGEVTVHDINEKILDVVAIADIVATTLTPPQGMTHWLEYR